MRKKTKRFALVLLIIMQVFQSEVPAKFPAGFASLHSNCQRNKYRWIDVLRINDVWHSEDKENTYWPLPTIIVSLKSYCFLNLQDLRFNGVYPFQNLRIAHKADKPVNRKKNWTNWYIKRHWPICFYTISAFIFFIFPVSVGRPKQLNLTGCEVIMTELLDTPD